jgi:hypothetical protein
VNRRYRETLLKPLPFAMTTHLFAAPEFLGLLRFWDEQRGARALPEWRGDLTGLAEALHANLIIADGTPPVYRYAGSEVIRRWGSPITGRPVFEVLQGGHARYIRSLYLDTISRALPIFSAAAFQIDDLTMMMTGRLFAPFARPGETAPSVMMSVQLFGGTDETLPAVGRRGFVHETRRDLIALAPELCTRLEDAGRYYRIAHGTHHRDIAEAMATIAHELSGSALVSLACLPETDAAPST